MRGHVVATLAAAVALALSHAPAVHAGTTFDVTIVPCQECIGGFRFEPNNLTIDVGDSVRWTNPTTVQHTATENITCEPHVGAPPFLPKPTGCIFDSLEMSTGNGFGHRFTGPGEFLYHCDVHHFFASILVEGTAQPDLALDEPVVGDGGAAGAPVGHTKIVDVTVRNAGVAGSAATELFVAYLYKGTPHEIGTVDVPPLPANGSTVKHVLWSVVGAPNNQPRALVGEFTVIATIDPAGLLTEENESNNTASTTAQILAPLSPGIDLADP